MDVVCAVGQLTLVPPTPSTHPIVSQALGLIAGSSDTLAPTKPIPPAPSYSAFAPIPPSASDPNIPTTPRSFSDISPPPSPSGPRARYSLTGGLGNVSTSSFQESVRQYEQQVSELREKLNFFQETRHAYVSPFSSPRVDHFQVIFFSPRFLLFSPILLVFHHYLDLGEVLCSCLVVHPWESNTEELSRLCLIRNFFLVSYLVHQQDRLLPPLLAAKQ